MNTLEKQADEISTELAANPKLYAKVLDGLVVKTAKVPDQVTKIAAQIQKDTGVKEDEALKMAWASYTKYINPTHPKAEKPTVKVAAADDKPGAMKTETARGLAAKLAGVLGKDRK